MLTPRPWQETSIIQLLEILPRNGGAVDASDMGTGKTLDAVEVVRRYDLPTLVMCPKACIPGWTRTAQAQGVELDVLNYEMLRTGNTPYGEWRGNDHFKWHPGVKRLIVDEVHRCRSYKSLQSAMLRAARDQNIQTLGLSATMADTPLEMDSLGYILRLHDSSNKGTLRNPFPRHFLDWAAHYGCRMTAAGPEFCGSNADMVRMNAAIFPSRGVRVKISDLGNQFPETQITAELVDVGDPVQADAYYVQMEAALAKLAERTSEYCLADPLVALSGELQQVELLKVPVIVSMATDALAQGYHIVIFVNYRLTLEEVCRRLNTSCVIHGGQVGDTGASERERNRKRFEDDLEPVIVCTGGAGGVGLDLPDIHGNFPRYVINSPGFDAKQERQKCGRVHRATAKTKSLQRFIFAANTCEEGVYRAVSAKMDRLDALNDADLTPKNLQIVRPG